MHRVGLAVVQLTRSTSAEATAGRESLQPSALRARCTRKGSRAFNRCQAPRNRNYRKYRVLRSCSAFASAIRPESGNQRRNAPKPVLLRPAIRLTSAEASACRRAINLRRSVLGAIGTLRVDRGGVKRTATRFPAVCDLFFTTRTYLRLALCALSQKRTKDSPSRVRFRPLPRLTFRFRVRPPGRASSYSRPVLGAAAIYALVGTLARGSDDRKAANCEGPGTGWRRSTSW